MQQRGISICLVVLFLLLVWGSSSISAQGEFPETQSIAIALYDADMDHLLYGKNAFERRSIASLTKIMTMFYTAELVQASKVSLSDKITASSNAASRGGTEIKLRGGDEFTLEELLYASALASANDAAVAIAEYIGGSEKSFAAKMTERAAEMGLKDTNFVDSTGLVSIYSGNYSSAYDMAVLSDAAMANPLFHKLVSTKEYELKPQGRTIRNSNVLLHEVEGVDGIKTGATTPAGHCLITSVVREGRRLILVVLGAPSRETRNEESEMIVNWAYDQLKTLIPKNQIVTQVTVRDGANHLINAVPAQDISVFLIGAKSEKDFTTRVETLDLRAPIDRGTKVGELVVLQNNEEIGRFDLLANESTGLASFLRRIWYRIMGFFDRLL